MAPGPDSATRATCTARPPAAPPSAATADPRLSLVLLTWNGRDETLACLAGLQPQLAAGDTVFLVDNGSTDGTEDAVRARFPWVHFVQNGENLGFAAGNNRGLALALAQGAPWIMLLNTDTRLEPGALAAWRARARTSPPQVGVWQALLLRDADPTVIDSAGQVLGTFPGARELLAGAPAASLAGEPCEIFGACGAAALMRREALAAAGLLDEALFVLLEDVDLMFRIRAAGFTAMLAPDVRVRHRRGVSGRTSPVSHRRRRFWLQRNVVALALRYWPLPALGLGAPVLAWRAAQALAYGGRGEAARTLGLWRSALRERPTLRARMRARGVDRWLGARPLNLRAAAADKPKDMTVPACAPIRTTADPVPVDACRICGNPNLVAVLDLGEQALTGVFPRRRGTPITRGPLRLAKCHGTSDCCGLVQLTHTYDLAAMYGDNYGYRSGLNRAMVRHLADKVAWLRKRRPLAAGEVVLDIGSNDATLLSQYPDDVIRVGIDPTTEKFRRFHPPDVIALAEFFTADAFQRAVGDRKAGIVTSVAMFYDLPQPMQFVADVASVLADDGIWHLEQSYLPAMLAANAYDTVCHEHLEYYGLRQIQWMTSRAGLGITDVQRNDVNGGSFAVTVQKGRPDAPIVADMLASEAGLDDLATWQQFAALVAQHRDDLRQLLIELKAAGKKVHALGASTKGNVVLQYAGITPDLVAGVAEVNADKFGCFTPGTELPILSEDDVVREQPDVLLVLPWHFRSGFVAARSEFLASGGQLLFPLPSIELVGAEAGSLADARP